VAKQISKALSNTLRLPSEAPWASRKLNVRNEIGRVRPVGDKVIEQALHRCERGFGCMCCTVSQPLGILPALDVHQASSSGPLGGILQEAAHGDSQLVERVGPGGVERRRNRRTRGWNAQSTVAYHSASFEPKRPLRALWLTPNSRLRVRSATPSYPWVQKLSTRH